MPTAGAQIFLGSTEHDAQIAKQKHDDEEGDSHPPHIGLERNKKSQTQSDEEGVGARCNAEQQHCRPAGNVVGRQWLLLLTKGGEEHAQRHDNHETEIDQIVVFGEPEPQQVANIKSCNHEQYMDNGDQKGVAQTTSEADRVLQCASTQCNHYGNRQGKGES